MRRSPSILLLTTSYPLSQESVSGIFIKQLASAVAELTDICILTPANTNLRSNTNELWPVTTTFRYAPSKLQLLAHNPGGIPAALKHKPWLHILVIPFLISMFFACIWHGKSKDILFANWSICGLVAGIAGKVIRKPTVVTLRGEDVNRSNSSTLYHWLLKACLFFCDRVIVVSDAIAQQLQSEFPRLSWKIHMIPNGVNDDFLSLPPPLQRDDKIRLIFIGSLISRKSLDTLLKATSKLPEIYTLKVVGDGPVRSDLEKLCKSLNISERVIFLGNINHNEIPYLLSKTDILVLPSLSEGRPNVILEAFAANRTVVASDIDGIRELIGNNERGLLFPVKDDFELASLLLRLADKGIRRRHAEAAKDFIIKNGLTWKRTAHKYFMVFKSLDNQGKHECVE